MRGFTLVEALVVLAISAILVVTALPDMRALYQRYQIEAERAQFATLINAARHAAANLNQTVTLCPGSNHICHGRNQWHHGAFIFTDLDRDRQKDPNEPVLGAVSDMTSRVRWRAFRNRTVLQFTPTGYTAWQNGHFIFCPANNDASLARQLVLNAVGRLYFSHDHDEDGFHEDVRGRRLSC